VRAVGGAISQVYTECPQASGLYIGSSRDASIKVICAGIRQSRDVTRGPAICTGARRVLKLCRSKGLWVHLRSSYWRPDTGPTAFPTSGLILGAVGEIACCAKGVTGGVNPLALGAAAVWPWYCRSILCIGPLTRCGLKSSFAQGSLLALRLRPQNEKSVVGSSQASSGHAVAPALAHMPRQSSVFPSLTNWSHGFGALIQRHTARP